ncbi:MAG TPA: hypothetical protein VE964_08370 [Myxococcales bacterium]|nr:hypothetical protein [Myxococcales bacterium]
MKRLLPALLLAVCAACGGGLVDHNGVDLQSNLTCNAPLELCNGACMALDSDVNNCGACGNSCTTPSNTSRTCVQRACSFVCNPGFFLSGDGKSCSPASTIAAGGDTSCAVVDGQVRCWGSNSDGQLGTDPTGALFSAKPVVVPGITVAVSSVAVGGKHACAIATGTGDVWCWGGNASGQLGDGGTTPHGAQKVPGITGATSLALGGLHSCALTAAEMDCWGANESGQLGDNTVIDRHVPTPVVALPAVPSSISAGAQFTCAVSAAGVWCWGANGAGQVFPSIESYAKKAVQITNVSAAFSIGLGAGHACAIGSSLWCWGADSFGQVGDGKMQNSSNGLVGVGGVSAPVAVAGGLAHTCAIAGGTGTDAGGAFCWGSNSSGQLGENLQNPVELKPVHVLGLNGVRSLALGATHSCAQTGDGLVYCWGNNSNFQIGIQGGPLTVLSPTLIQQ